MRKSDSVKGSITVFAALSLMLVSSLLFTLLEGARVCEFEQLAKEETESAAESLFANYNSDLWEEYHMLLLDDGGDSDFTCDVRNTYLLGLLNNNFAVAASDNANLLQGKCTAVDLEDYVLIADGNGAAFEAAVAAYMKNNAVYETASVLSEWADSVNGLEESGTDLEGDMDAAVDLLETGLDSQNSNVPSKNKFAIEQSQTDADNSQPEDEEADAGRSLLYDMQKKQGTGILTQVLPQGTEVSAVSIDKDTIMSGRTLAVGTGQTPECSAEDHLLTVAYLLNHFSSYTEQKEDHALQYELEYIIAGKKTDEANLKSVANRLLLIREAANFISLLADEEKVAEAESMATSICTLLYIPECSAILESGILASWAYAESVLDVRALLQGKKIALVKTSAQWTSELTNMSYLMDSFAEAEECQDGLTYENYLGAMLLLLTVKHRSYRALDAMEASVRKADQSECFCIDHTFLEAEVDAGFSYPTVFWGMESITASFDSRLYVKGKAFYSYRKAGA